MPRSPSNTSNIFSGTTALVKGGTSGRVTLNQVGTEELELATTEIVWLSDKVALLKLRILEEENKRREAEIGLRVAQEKFETIAEATRQECRNKLERQLQEEQRRWKGALTAEVEFRLLGSLAFPFWW